MNPYIGQITLPAGIEVDANVLIRSLFLFAIAASGLIFFFMLILGGFRYLTAGGDEKAASAAQATLTRAFMGLVIVLAAVLIVKLISVVFKIPGISVI